MKTSGLIGVLLAVLLLAFPVEPAVGQAQTPGHRAADWTAESDQSGARMQQVRAAGDVNGDGFDDVAVGAYRYSDGQTDEGKAYLFLGSPLGLSRSPGWTAESGQTGAYFGLSVGTAGDVNGDGYDDVIVGAPTYDHGQTDEGRVFVYYGSASGLSPIADWTAESDQAKAELGPADTAGDVNGDGYDDVIVGAPGYDHGQADEGRVFVYYGSASGLSPIADWTAESDQAGANFGHSVATAGDVNGDGYDDVIVGAYGYGNGQTRGGGAFLYLGSAGGLGAAAWTAESNQDGALFGSSVARAGDVNGDGYDDVVVGAPHDTNGQHEEGRAFLYLGAAAGLGPTAAWTAESNQNGAFFGGSVATAGDTNGDGYDDLIVGADEYDDGQPSEGRIFEFWGSPTGPSPRPWTAESNQANASFGGSVGTGEDVNGDGVADLLVGAGRLDHPEPDEGMVFAYYGSVRG